MRFRSTSNDRIMGSKDPQAALTEVLDEIDTQRGQ
jgi:hypothetical protein